MHLFIEDSIFCNFWPNFGPRFWDIFFISGNTLMNHFLCIVISCEKVKDGYVRIRDPMHLFIENSIFYNFWPNFAPRYWDIFSISGNALMNHSFSIVISFEKAKDGSVRICGSDATFHWRFKFLNIFAFSPDFEIFSGFQEMRLWITSLAS